MSCLLGLNPRLDLDSYLKIETNTDFFTVLTGNKDLENRSSRVRRTYKSLRGRSENEPNHLKLKALSSGH